jgi:hypothetical protein
MDVSRVLLDCRTPSICNVVEVGPIPSTIFDLLQHKAEIADFAKPMI